MIIQSSRAGCAEQLRPRPLPQLLPKLLQPLERPPRSRAKCPLIKFGPAGMYANRRRMAETGRNVKQGCRGGKEGRQARSSAGLGLG